MRTAVALLVLTLLGLPAVAGAQGCWVWEANLMGELVWPPTQSPGQAQVSASFLSCQPCIAETGDSLEVQITILEDLGSSAIAAEFRRGAVGANGAIFMSLPLQDATFPAVRSTVIPASLCSFLSDTLTYVVITTVEYPAGEIRGQLIPRPPVPVRTLTWGQIRWLYR